MNQEIQNILADLYKMDPGLREKESEIIKIINELVAARPDTKFDENFKRQLRAKITERAAALSAAKPKKAWFTIPKFAYALGGIAAIALVALAAIYPGTKGTSMLSLAGPHNLAGTNSTVSIKKLAANAFGTLTPAGQAGGQELSAPASADGSSAASNSAVPAGQSAPAAVTAPEAGVSAGSGAGSASAAVGKALIMPIRAVNYKFVYKGGDLPQVPDTMDVLNRISGSGVSAASLLSNTGLNFINWSRFSNTKLQNISFNEDKDNGYSVYINFEDGSVSINQNWSRWIGAAGGTVSCMSTGCVQPPVQPLKITDVPDDSKIIAVAGSFISNYGISLANYGPPFVQSDWRAQYEASTDKADYYIPQQMSVIYPLVINGQEVYDESGNKVGLTVTVDIGQMQVVSVSNLMTQNYESSSYATEKDSGRIIRLAEKGGFRQVYYWYGGDNSETEIDLGTPAVGLVQMWFNRDGQSQQFLVPTYIFAVLNKPQNAAYYQNEVIVPAIKDILDWGNSGGGGVVPMMRGTVQTETSPAPVPAVKSGPLVK